jgi:hypothetical protein
MAWEDNGVVRRGVLSRPGSSSSAIDIQRTYEELRDPGVEFSMEPTQHD